MSEHNMVSNTTRTGAGLEPALDGLVTGLGYTEWLVLLPEKGGRCRWLKADGTGTTELDGAQRFKSSDLAREHAGLFELKKARVLPVRIRMDVPDDHSGWKL